MIKRYKKGFYLYINTLIQINALGDSCDTDRFRKLMEKLDIVGNALGFTKEEQNDVNEAFCKIYPSSTDTLYKILVVSD